MKNVERLRDESLTRSIEGYKRHNPESDQESRKSPIEVSHGCRFKQRRLTGVWWDCVASVAVSSWRCQAIRKMD